jgi:hypothetical protein
MNQRDDVESGAKVKIRIAVLISVGFLATASGQESRQTSEAVALPIGLEIGQMRWLRRKLEPISPSHEYLSMSYSCAGAVACIPA